MSSHPLQLTLELSVELYESMRTSLLPEDDEREHAAFLLARPEGEYLLAVEDVAPLPESAFDTQSHGYLALRDGALQEMILRAHRAGVALVEAHSHPFSCGPDVAFSPYDCEGLATTAPHVFWRLAGRPYGALVFGQDGFDGLFWAERLQDPSGVIDMVVGGVRHKPSGESFRLWSVYGG